MTISVKWVVLVVEGGRGGLEADCGDWTLYFSSKEFRHII